jgi:hypothetical protein
MRPAERYSRIEGILDAQHVLPKLLTAEEASDLTKLSPERLRELAATGLAPCVRIDGGDPLFFRTDILAWVKENVIRIQPGRRLEAPLIEDLSDVAADAGDIPALLRPYLGALREHRGFTGASVYFLIRGREVVYVGQTQELTLRVERHRRDKHFDRVLYLRVPAQDLSRVEQAFLRALRPSLNQVLGSPGDPVGTLIELSEAASRIQN